jgi:UPF0271 protein
VKVLVLDTSALIMGLDPLGLDFQTYSVPEVLEELKGQQGPWYRVSVSMSSGKLKIRSPTPGAIQKILEKAKALGDKVVLSKADKSVLALALDLVEEETTPIVVSDDYAVQNVAEGIGVAYQSLANLGIREKFEWTYYCPACFRTYPTGDLQVCEICGTELKRKPLRKQTARNRYSTES